MGVRETKEANHEAMLKTLLKPAKFVQCVWRVLWMMTMSVAEMGPLKVDKGVDE